MTTRQRLGAVVGTAVALLFLCSCAAPYSVPAVEKAVWSENGTVMGTLVKAPRPFGLEYRYLDPEQRLRRVEKRNASGALLPGETIVDYAYDNSGRPVREVHYDSERRAAPCDAGYVVKETAYGTEGDNPVVEVSCHDAAGKLVKAADGAALTRTVYLSGSSKPKNERYFGPDRRPCGVNRFGVEGVAEVEYAYLEGVGEVVCAVIYDVKHQVLARKMVSGHVVKSWTHTTETTRYIRPSGSGRRR